MQLVAPNGTARIIMIASKEVSLFMCILPFAPMHIFSVHMYKLNEDENDRTSKIELFLWRLTCFTQLSFLPFNFSLHYLSIHILKATDPLVSAESFLSISFSICSQFFFLLECVQTPRLFIYCLSLREPEVDVDCLGTTYPSCHLHAKFCSNPAPAFDFQVF